MELKYYPYILTEQRISLMTDEEKMQYCFEHSDYCDWCAKERALMRAQFREAYGNVRQQYLNEMMESGEFANESEETLNEMAEQLTQFETEYVMNEVAEILKPVIMENAMTQEEYDQIVEYVKEHMLDEDDSLNENTVGPDMTWWAKSFGAMINATLLPLFSGMGYLIMLGKSQGAIKSLKKYMNKLVEELDDGTYKKQGFFSNIMNKLLGKFKFGKTSENQSHSSFRELQEVFEGNIACKAMVLMKNIGLLPDNYDAAKQAMENNVFNQGGYAVFVENIASPLSKLCNKI